VACTCTAPLLCCTNRRQVGNRPNSLMCCDVPRLCSYNSWSGSLDLILPQPPYTSKRAGWVGFGATVALLVGGMAIGPIADRFAFFHRRLRLLIILVLLLGLVAMTWATLSLPVLGKVPCKRTVLSWLPCRVLSCVLSRPWLWACRAHVPEHCAPPLQDMSLCCRVKLSALPRLWRSLGCAWALSTHCSTSLVLSSPSLHPNLCLLGLFLLSVAAVVALSYPSAYTQVTPHDRWRSRVRSVRVPPCVSQANNVWALVFLFALPAIGARTINVVFLCGMAATTLLTVCVREEYRRQDREARVHTAEGPGMDGDEILKIAAGTPQLSSSQTPTSVASVDTPLLP